MKKTLSLLLVTVLMLTAVFALSGCGKRAIDIDDLEDFLEDEGFEVDTYDDEEDDVDVEYLDAYDDDNGIDIEFKVFDEDDKDTEDLIDEFDDDFDDAMDEVPDEAEIITSKKSKDYVCLEALYDGEYLFAARIKNTVISCECDEEYMEDAQKLMKKIGYK